MKTLRGLAVSPGVAIGKAVVIQYDIKVPDFTIPETDIRLELLKFDASLALSREQLLAVREKDGGCDDTIKKLLDSQLLILVDPLFVGEVINKVKEEKRNIEKVVWDVVNEFSRMFDSMNDPYLRERASDVRDVGGRILRNLLGEDPPPLHLLEEETILVCDHLNVSEVAHLDPERVVGLVSEVGGETSHPAILARSLGIPSLVGVVDATKTVKNGDKLIVDCVKSRVIVDPDAEEEEAFHSLRQEFEVSWQKLLDQSLGEAVTTEGVELNFLANISVPAEIDQVHRFGASGVGLFRTEYLYMNQASFPGEEIQFEAYRKVISGAAPGVATIRTLDIGGDKELPYLCFVKEANPFLGWRSIRFCLDNPDIFRTQLRALLRASTAGNLRMMFPMISTLAELRQAKAHLQAVQQEFIERGEAFDQNMEVGIMIEVPSAAMIADQLAREVDFFSIGTNDLTQFTLAVDRTNQKLANRFCSFSPGVLRIIDHVVRAAQNQGISVSCCGEMTGQPLGFLLLLGLGVRDFSCNLFAVPQMKKMMDGVELVEVEQLAQKALNAESSDEVRQLFDSLQQRLVSAADSLQF